MVQTDYYCNNCRKNVSPKWKECHTSKGSKVKIGYCPFCADPISSKLKETWE